MGADLGRVSLGSDSLGFFAHQGNMPLSSFVARIVFGESFPMSDRAQDFFISSYPAGIPRSVQPINEPLLTIVVDPKACQSKATLLTRLIERGFGRDAYDVPIVFPSEAGLLLDKQSLPKVLVFISRDQLLESIGQTVVEDLEQLDAIFFAPGLNELSRSPRVKRTFWSEVQQWLSR